MTKKNVAGFRMRDTSIAFRMHAHHRTCFDGAVGFQESHQLVELDDELPDMFINPGVDIASIWLAQDGADIGRIFPCLTEAY